MSRRVVLLGVASSAGTHHAGQDHVPAALRSAGLLDRLRAEGVTVEDRGDLVHEAFVADEMNSTARNMAAVLRVARTVADAVADTLADGGLPLVVGGDCTITLGVVAGAQRHDPATGLLYLDGDAGLADTELARLGVAVPMLTDERLALIGYDETDRETFAATILADHPALVRFADHEVRAAAGEVLSVLCAAPTLAAIVLTEVNPSYDPTGRQLARYVDTVAAAIGHGLTRQRPNRH